MKIHEILDESLPISTAKKYRKVWNPNTYADFFQKYPSEKDKNAFRLYIPLKPTKVPTIKVPQNISEYLSNLGYEVLDYKSGIAQSKKDKRQIRIGKLLSKEPKLKQEFDNDKSRQATKKQDILVCISRHPYDIAGMSTDRGWTSCMNLTDGSNKKYVLQDVKQNGLAIQYIKNPYPSVLEYAQAYI